MSHTYFQLSEVTLLLRRALVASVLLPVAGLAAVIPPGAGALENQLRQSTPVDRHLPQLTSPALQLPPGENGQAIMPEDDTFSVTLRDVRLTGTEPGGTARLSSAEKDSLISSVLGKPVSFRQLQTLASQLTSAYRDRGALMARVILPPQTIRDGVLIMEVIPGTFGSYHLDNRGSAGESLLERVLDATTPEGEVITRERLERLALLLNDIPGVQGSVSLTRGNRSGTASLNVRTEQGKQYGGYAGLDNLGTPVTGRSRLLAGGFVNGLFTTGDQLRLDGAVGYEKGGQVNGRLDYSLPAGGYGTRTGAAYSRLDYQYDFQHMTFSGHSDTWEAYISHPLLLTAGAQVNMRLSAGQSYLTDHYPSLLSFAGTEGRKTITSGVAGLSGSFASLPGGVSGAAVELTIGDMHYQDEGARFWAGSELRNTEGAFTIMNWQVQHEQQVWGPVTLMFRGSGQVTDRNLDASRKLVLGGPSAVRAFDIGDGTVDTGTLATAEVRGTWELPSSWSWSGKTQSLTMAGFYDHGWGEQNRNNNSRAGMPLTEKNRVELSGAGVSATLAGVGDYAVSATWAHRTSGADPVSGNKDNNRFWLSAMKTF